MSLTRLDSRAYSGSSSSGVSVGSQKCERTKAAHVWLCNFRVTFALLLLHYCNVHSICVAQSFHAPVTSRHDHASGNFPRLHFSQRSLDLQRLWTNTHAGIPFTLKAPGIAAFHPTVVICHLETSLSKVAITLQHRGIFDIPARGICSRKQSNLAT